MKYNVISNKFINILLYLLYEWSIYIHIHSGAKVITCLYIPHFGATKKENSKANEVIFFRIYSIFNLLQIVKNNQQKEGHRRKEKKKQEN